MENLAILVLAAGSSSRMNSVKQLEKIEGEYLLDITLKKVKLISKQNIFCVLGANYQLIKQKITTNNIRFIYNKDYKKGLSTSIISGIQTIFEKKEIDSILILLADQPAISVFYLKKMIALSKKQNSKIVASTYKNGFGVPVIIPKAYFEKLLHISGDKGAKQFLESNKGEIISPKEKTNLFDIDTQEDLRNFKKLTHENH